MRLSALRWDAVVIDRTNERWRALLDLARLLLAARVDDAKQGVAQADVYQMMAYARLYACPRVTLLYPHYRELGATPLADAYRINLSGCDDRLEVATVDVGVGDTARQLDEAVRQRLHDMCGVKMPEFG